VHNIQLEVGKYYKQISDELTIVFNNLGRVLERVEINSCFLVLNNNIGYSINGVQDTLVLTSLGNIGTMGSIQLNYNRIKKII